LPNNLQFLENGGSSPSARFCNPEGFAYIREPLKVSAKSGAVSEKPATLESNDNVVLGEDVREIGKRTADGSYDIFRGTKLPKIGMWRGFRLFVLWRTLSGLR